ESLPAEANPPVADTPSASPSATCATLQCPPNFYDFPAANVGAVTLPGKAVTINVLAHDCHSTLSGQVYSFTLGSPVSGSGGSAGSVTANTANNLGFTPASGFTGVAHFSYSWNLTTGSEINPASGSTITIRGLSSGLPTVGVEVWSVDPQGSALIGDLFGGGSPNEPCQCTGVPATSSTLDPVNTATGDYYQTSTDLSLPGAGVPLAFTRTYDAEAAQGEALAGSTAPPLGYGWADNLGMNVAYDSLLGVATVIDENGAETTFAPYVSGSSPAWCTGA